MHVQAAGGQQGRVPAAYVEENAPAATPTVSPRVSSASSPQGEQSILLTAVYDFEPKEESGGGDLRLRAGDRVSVVPARQSEEATNDAYVQ